MTNELRCLDHSSKSKIECAGEVEYRTTPDRTDGKFFPRCEAHFEARLDQAQHNLELLSATPPPWFDEAYAGEHWDESY